jgi:hypothetical protein
MIALAGCGNALDSRANDLAACMEDRGFRATANTHGTEGISVDGHFRQIEYAEVHVEAERGKTPPIYNVQVYSSDDDGRIWIQGLHEPGSPRQTLLLDGGRAVMFGLGVAQQQPVVEGCLKAE